MNRRVTDREVYPALLVTLAALAGLYLLWRGPLGRPTIAVCWFYSNWHIYCPACGGTRALIALSRGELLRACYYNPAVPFTAVSAAAYLLSQTIWRLRGRRGWALHYRDCWLVVLLLLFLINCVVRNILWFVFQIPL